VAANFPRECLTPSHLIAATESRRFDCRRFLHHNEAGAIQGLNQALCGDHRHELARSSPRTPALTISPNQGVAGLNPDHANAIE
jgi:hypothetical protein